MFAGVILAAYATGSAELTLAAGFAAMAAAGCLYLRDWASFRPRLFDFGLARSFLSFGGPVGFTKALSGLITSGTPLLLGALAGYEAVAAFTVSNTLVQNTLGVITTGIAAATFPVAVRAVEGSDAASARKVLARNYMLLLSILLPAGAGFVLLSHGVAEVFVGPAYRDAVARTVPWLVLATVLLGLRSFYVDYSFHLAKTTGLLVRVVLIGVLANIALCFVLIRALGQEGAALAIAGSAAIMLVHASVLSRRAYPMPAPLGETLRIATATCVMAVLVGTAALPAGLAGLFAGMGLGIVAYAAVYAVLDALGPRHLARTVLPRLRSRGTRSERPAA
jgi:O-antigen/teichoic acid export membrane protein